MKITTFDPKKKKDVTVGTLKGDTLTRVVTKKHWCFKHSTYGGIQVEAIENLKMLNCTKVVTKNKKENKVYTSSLVDWEGPNSILDNLGNGDQRFLQDKYMTEVQ